MKTTLIALVYKDMLLQKRTVFFLLFFMLMLIVSMSGSGMSSPYITATVGASLFWTMSVCSYEGFYKMEKLFASLPTTRLEMVLARYLSSLGVILVSILLSTSVGWIVTLMPISSSVVPATIMEAVTAFLIASILVFGYLPIYFKVGYLRSRMLNIAVFAVIGLVIAGLSFLIDALGINLTVTPLVWVLLILILWIALGIGSFLLAVRFFHSRAL